MTGERRQGSWNIKIPDWQFAINADSQPSLKIEQPPNTISMVPAPAAVFGK
jgi:hypothetical protein